MYIGRDVVKCRLAHTPIEAIIAKENLSSRPDWERLDLRKILQRDQVVVGRIIALKVDEDLGQKVFHLELTTRSKDLEDVLRWEKM